MLSQGLQRWVQRGLAGEESHEGHIMLKILTPLIVLSAVAALAYRWQRQQAIQAVPTAEHKKQWDTRTQWTGISWE
jgi:hypothetical protein